MTTKDIECPRMYRSRLTATDCPLTDTARDVSCATGQQSWPRTACLHTLGDMADVNNVTLPTLISRTLTMLIADRNLLRWLPYTTGKQQSVHAAAQWASQQLHSLHNVANTQDTTTHPQPQTSQDDKMYQFSKILTNPFRMRVDQQLQPASCRHDIPRPCRESLLLLGLQHPLCRLLDLVLRVV